MNSTPIQAMASDVYASLLAAALVWLVQVERQRQATVHLDGKTGGNRNQLLSTKRPKLVFHLRQWYLHIWCVKVWASHAGSSGALLEVLFSVFLACPCAIHCFEMIWNAASLSSPLPTGRTLHTATSVK